MAHFIFYCLIGILLCVYDTNCVTLKEGLADPKKYIMYDTTEFNIGMHCGIALLQSYIILGIFIGGVFLVGKLTGRKRPRRSVVIGDDEPTYAVAPVQPVMMPEVPVNEKMLNAEPRYGSGVYDAYSQGQGSHLSYARDPYAGYDGASKHDSYAGYDDGASNRDPYAGY